jgi:hypothetical protein
MSKAKADTNSRWHPSAEQAEVIDLLASGYSQLAISRVTGIPQPTIWGWQNSLVSFSDQFNALVDTRAAEFRAAKDAVHEQQVVMALQVIQEALSGEMQRERAGDSYVTPLRFEAAVKLLQSTFWKQQSGGHKQIGTP